MKRTILILTLLSTVLIAFSQTPITLQSSDYFTVNDTLPEYVVSFGETVVNVADWLPENNEFGDYHNLNTTLDSVYLDTTTYTAPELLSDTLFTSSTCKNVDREDRTLFYTITENSIVVDGVTGLVPVISNDSNIAVRFDQPLLVANFPVDSESQVNNSATGCTLLPIEAIHALVTQLAQLAQLTGPLAESIYNALAEKYDSVKLSVDVSLITSIDDSGEITFTGDTTIHGTYNYLREKFFMRTVGNAFLREKTSGNFAQLDTCKITLPYLGEVELGSYLPSDSKVPIIDTVCSYRYWTNGMHGPIMEIFTDPTRERIETIVTRSDLRSMSVSPTELSFAAAGATQTVTVTANTSWTVSKNAEADWLTLSTEAGSNNGTFNVTATENTGAERTATVTVRGENISTPVEIAVTQAADQAVPTLSVSPTELSFAATGESKTVTVTANTSWTVSKNPEADWLTLSTEAGSFEAGSNNGSFNVTATENTSAERTATVTVRGENISTPVEITVTQAADQAIPTLSVSPTELSFAATGESKTVTVTANTSWTVSKNAEADWLTLSPEAGSNNGTFNVTAIENTGAERTDTITVAGEGVEAVEITVTQAAGATGISEVVEAAISVYPNPVSSLLTVDVAGLLNDGFVVISSIDGKVVKEVRINGGQTNVDVQQLVAGSYVYEITDSSRQRLSCGLFVKE